MTDLFDFLGNRWIVSLWTTTSHKQPPLDVSDLEGAYRPPTPAEYDIPEEYLELQRREEKRESEI